MKSGSWLDDSIVVTAKRCLEVREWEHLLRLPAAPCCEKTEVHHVRSAVKLGDTLADLGLHGGLRELRIHAQDCFI
jgi:hypothetical protein